ncbi:hypothetical protein EGR_06225 [Echinococcus granulosus]|uniref:Uncharacterized protein n=2 Tax=Echinococcus granulosus TaxID=6210 RepID=W6UZ68_ECHGR|nr:hypothetical protein EGR_06225 [Echinococcus granulosus]EUB58909.1 hypothetical protein EGR_06225 [Echinococcus granulosus]
MKEPPHFPIPQPANGPTEASPHPNQSEQVPAVNRPMGEGVVGKSGWFRASLEAGGLYMLENPDTVIADSQVDSLLALFHPTRSKSLPDLREAPPDPAQDPNLPSYRLPTRVYTSTFQLPGSRAFFLTPVGPQHFISQLSKGVFSGRIYAPSAAQEKYLTTHVSIRTHFSRPHELEDLQGLQLRRYTDFFYFRQHRWKEKGNNKKTENPETELSITSTGLNNILPTQQDSSLTLLSAEDLTVTKAQEEKEEDIMAVPMQYDVEHQLNGRDEAMEVITQKNVSVSDLRRKFEEAQTMYLPRDPTVLKERPRVTRREKRSCSLEPLRSRPRSAAYERHEDDKLFSVKRPDSLRSLPLREQHSPLRSRNGFTRKYEPEKHQTLQERQRWSVSYGAPQPIRRSDEYSPTRRKLLGIKRNASPRSMNRAAGSNDWPDGIFTKTGDVYKRINNNGISYIIPTSPDSVKQVRSADYKQNQLTVDCSDHYSMRSPSPQMRDRPSPCLNYSYLEHIDTGGIKPYRSVNLSDWKGIPRAGKSTSCLSLNQPEVFRVKRYSVPRAAAGDDETWKVRAQEIGGGRRRIHMTRGSWSPVQAHPSPRSIPGDLEEETEREVRERGPQKNKIPSPSPPQPHLPVPEGIDESSISRAFDYNIARFEKLAVDSKKEALCTKGSGCCVHSPAARQPYPSRRLFSTRRMRSDRGFMNGDAGGTQPTKYRFERGGFDRYYGDGTVEVISSPGGKFHSHSYEPYPSP